MVGAVHNGGCGQQWWVWSTMVGVVHNGGCTGANFLRTMFS